MLSLQLCTDVDEDEILMMEEEDEFEQEGGSDVGGDVGGDAGGGGDALSPSKPKAKETG